MYKKIFVWRASFFRKASILFLMHRRMTDKVNRLDEDEEDEKGAGEQRPVFKSNFFVPAHPVLMFGMFCPCQARVLI